MARYETLVEDDREGVRIPFKLEETYDQSFRANNFNATWRTDTDILYSDNYIGDIRLFDVTTGTSRVLMDSSVAVRFARYFLTNLSISTRNKFHVDPLCQTLTRR